MKHAILILAHDQPAHLCRLVRLFDNDFDIYIHWCAKTPTPPAVKSLETTHIHIYSQFPINWGGWNMCEATNLLCTEALRLSPGAQYFHLISGTDYLIKPLDKFKQFFEKAHTNNTCYIKIYHAKSKKLKKHVSPDKDSIFLMHDLDKIDLRTASPEQINAYKNNLKFQYKNSAFLPTPPHKVVTGEQWWSLPRGAVQLIVDKFEYIKPYEEHSRIPDNRFVQTILCNFGYEKNIENTYLRYRRHDDKDATHHLAILGSRDYTPAIKSNEFWARKCTDEKSKVFCDAIDKFCGRK